MLQTLSFPNIPNTATNYTEEAEVFLPVDQAFICYQGYAEAGLCYPPKTQKKLTDILLKHCKTYLYHNCIFIIKSTRKPD